MIPAALILLFLILPLIVLGESLCWPGSFFDRSTRSRAHGWYQALGGFVMLGSLSLLVVGLVRWAWSFL